MDQIQAIRTQTAYAVTQDSKFRTLTQETRRATREAREFKRVWNRNSRLAKLPTL